MSSTPDGFGPASAVLPGPSPLCYVITWEAAPTTGVFATVIISGQFNDVGGQEVSWTSDVRKEHSYSGLDGVAPDVNKAYSDLENLLSRLRSVSCPSAWANTLLSGALTPHRIATACVAEALRSGPTAFPMSIRVQEPGDLGSSQVIYCLWGDRVMRQGANCPPSRQDDSASISTE